MATIKYRDPATEQWVEIPVGGGSSVTVDSALSSTSENPVQNKVINSALNGKQPTITSSDPLSASLVSGLSTVATSGSYSDLSNKPTIPAAANDGTLTIQKNGTSVATFGANQSTNATANIEVPTKVSELTDASNYVTKTTYAAQGTYGLAKIWLDTTDNYLHIRTDGQ